MIRNANIDDAKQIAIVRNNTWKTTYKGIISDEYLNDLNYEKREERFKKYLGEKNSKSFLNVYEDDKTKEIIGFVWFGEPLEDLEYDGEIYALYVLDSHQKKGIGRILINSALKKLRDMGTSSVIIWAIKGNQNAGKFYERMGGKLTKNKIVEIGGEKVTEVGYVIDGI